jgi:hypothetical protein
MTRLNVTEPDISRTRALIVRVGTPSSDVCKGDDRLDLVGVEVIISALVRLLVLEQLTGVGKYELVELG